MKGYSTASLLVILCALPALSNAKEGLKGSRRINRRLQGKEKKAEKDIEENRVGKDIIDPILKIKSKSSKSKNKSKSSKSKKDGIVKNPIKNIDTNLGTELAKRRGYSDEEISFPSTGNTTSFNEEVLLDCEAISNNRGPEETSRETLEMNLDILKEDTYGLTGLYAALEIELQEDVAPKIAGCATNGTRNLVQTKIVNVVFEAFKLDKGGCDSRLEIDSNPQAYTCISSDVPLHIYYVGDNPGNLKSIVESTVDSHTWKTPGIVEISNSEVTVVELNEDIPREGQKKKGGTNPSVFAFIGVILVGGIVGILFLRNRRTESNSLSKQYPDTDPDTDDEVPSNFQKNVPMVAAYPIEQNGKVSKW